MIQTKIKNKKVSNTNLFADILAAIDQDNSNKNSTISPEITEEPELVSSIFPAGQLADSSRNFDELATIKTDNLHARLEIWQKRRTNRKY